MVRQRLEGPQLHHADTPPALPAYLDTPYKEADILLPGYGVQLEGIAAETGDKSILNPLSVLEENGFKAVSFLAQKGIENGANVATLNNFWTRELVREGSSESLQLFSEVTRRNLEAVLQAESNAGKRAKHIVAQLGPGAKNCYDADTALSFAEAKEFHGEQARIVLDVDPKILPWYETFPTIDEARGAAAGVDGPAVISFVLKEGKPGQPGVLRSGESLHDAIRAVRDINPNIRFGANCFPIEAAEPTLDSLGSLIEHFGIVYANASSQDPENFDGSDENTILGLIDSNHTAQYLNYLVQKYGLEVIGGCCGYNYKTIGDFSKAVKSRLFTSILPPTDKSHADCNHSHSHGELVH